MSPRATDLTSSSVQNLLRSRTELDHRERDPIHGNARVRQGRDTGAYLGLVNYVRTFPAQSSADFKDHNTAHTRPGCSLIESTTPSDTHMRWSTVLYRSSVALRIALFNGNTEKVFRTPYLWRARTLDLRIPLSRLELRLQLQKAYLA